MVIGTFKPGNVKAGSRPIAAITPTNVAVMAMPAAEKTRCLGFMLALRKSRSDRLRLVNRPSACVNCPDQQRGTLATALPGVRTGRWVVAFDPISHPLRPVR